MKSGKRLIKLIAFGYNKLFVSFSGDTLAPNVILIYHRRQAVF